MSGHQRCFEKTGRASCTVELADARTREAGATVAGP